MSSLFIGPLFLSHIDSANEVAALRQHISRDRRQTWSFHRVVNPASTRSLRTLQHSREKKLARGAHNLWLGTGQSQVREGLPVARSLFERV